MPKNPPRPCVCGAITNRAPGKLCVVCAGLAAGRRASVRRGVADEDRLASLATLAAAGLSLFPERRRDR